MHLEMEAESTSMSLPAKSFIPHEEARGKHQMKMFNKITPYINVICLCSLHHVTVDLHGIASMIGTDVPLSNDNHAQAFEHKPSIMHCARLQTTQGGS